MTTGDSTSGLLLNGLDGGNPLGFLAAIGTAVVLQDIFPEIGLGWSRTRYGWRPALTGCGEDKQAFSESLLAALRCASMAAFDIDDKMPFETTSFTHALRCVQGCVSMSDRRDADFLVSFGTEMYPSEKGGFQDSIFRMVRSGDSAGQGLPFYAKDIRKKTRLEHIRRALFQAWDYQDKFDDRGKRYFSLRWDPIEDQRYALRWQDPSNKSGPIAGPGTVLAANSLAIEALQWFPVFLTGKQAQTTGFQRPRRRETYFIWPIWTPIVSIETVRSLLALNDLTKEPVPRSSLAKRGIEEIYRSQRIQQNQYYSNFTIAVPV